MVSDNEITYHKLICYIERDIKDYHPDAQHLLLEEAKGQEDLVAQMTYLFHPYLIANCAARTTTVFSNLLLVTFLLATVHKRHALKMNLAPLRKIL